MPCGCGAVSATTRARCACTRWRAPSSSATAARCRAIARRCSRCPASARTPRRPCARLRSNSTTSRSTRTSAASRTAPASASNIRRCATDAELDARARAALVPGHARTTGTRRMMDVGATICTARAPKCLLCPLRAGCAAAPVDAAAARGARAHASAPFAARVDSVRAHDALPARPHRRPVARRAARRSASRCSTCIARSRRPCSGRTRRGNRGRSSARPRARRRRDARRRPCDRAARMSRAWPRFRFLRRRCRARRRGRAGDSRSAPIRMPRRRSSIATRSNCSIAVILSAQCTDARVNLTTPFLFARYPTPREARRGRTADVESIIKSCGFFRMKAKNIIGRARDLVERFGGEVPRERERAGSAAGRRAQDRERRDVGRRLQKRRFAVDTHVFRVSHRLGFDARHDAARGGRRLTKLVPPRKVARRDALADPARPRDLQGADAALRAVPAQRALPDPSNN